MLIIPVADLAIFWTMNWSINGYGDDKMKPAHVKKMPILTNLRNSSAIQTTLYELMETVIDIADPDEKDLVNEVTINMLTKAKPRLRVSIR